MFLQTEPTSAQDPPGNTSTTVTVSASTNAAAATSGESLASQPSPWPLTVTTPSKFEQPLLQAPAAVSVVTREDIRRFGYRTLAELLTSVQGFYVSYDRLYTFLGVRGFNPGDFNSRVLLMVNGHRLNQNLSDAAAIGTDFLLDLDLVERVEIVRGPGSIMYGNNALLSVINVITRRPVDLPGAGAETSVAYGSFDTWRGRATFGKAFPSGLEFMVSGSYYDSQGDETLYYPQFDTPAQNDGVFENGDTDRSWSAFGSVAYGDFKLDGGFITRDKRNPTAQHGTTFDDNRHLLTDSRYYADLQFRRQLTEKLELLARAYYDRYEFEGTFPFSEGLVTLEQDKRLGQWYGSEVQLNRSLGFYHTVSVGGEFRHDFDQQRTYSQLEPTYELLSHSERDRLGYSAFVNGEFMLFPERLPDKLSLNAGIRYDGYDQFDDAFNPRVALVYHPWKTSALKAIYGTAFRTPNFFELFDPANQDISPEHVSTYELVYEQQISRNFRGTVTGFYNRIEDAIAFDFQPAASRYRNFEGAETWGFSVEGDAIATGGPVPGLRGRLAYTYQQAENLETDARLTDSPEHLVKAQVSVPFWRERLIASAEVQYTSERLTVVPGPGGTLVPGRNAEDFVTVNVTLLAQKIVKNLEASATVYNLFEEYYSDPATLFHQQDLIPQNGRTFQVKLTYRF